MANLLFLKKTLESISYDYRKGEVEITQENFENVVLTGEIDCNLIEIKAILDEVKFW